MVVGAVVVVVVHSQIRGERILVAQVALVVLPVEVVGQQVLLVVL